MVGALGGVALLLIVLGIGYWLVSAMDDAEQRNNAMRQAIKDVARYKDRYLRAKQRESSARRSAPAGPLELNTYVEKAASAVGVKIDESAETSPVETPRFVQRGLQIKLRKINVSQLGTLLKTLEEESGRRVQVTELSVHTRWQHNEELDVELVVTTYEAPKGAPAAKRPTARGRKG